MKPPNRPHAMVDQSQALDAYLQDLLAPPVARGAALEGAPADDVLPESPAPAESRAATPTTSSVDAAVSPGGAGVAAPTAPAAPFEVRLFEVAGLALAVPVAELSGVISGADSLVPVPGCASLVAGLVTHAGRQVKVIDTARLILPPQHVAGLATDPAPRCRQLLLSARGDWALACARVGERFVLDPADVNWRGEGGKRPWLAGTVRQRRCALVDVAGLTRLLAADGD